MLRRQESSVPSRHRGRSRCGRKAGETKRVLLALPSFPRLRRGACACFPDCGRKACRVSAWACRCGALGRWADTDRMPPEWRAPLGRRVTRMPLRATGGSRAFFARSRAFCRSLLTKHVRGDPEVSNRMAPTVAVGEQWFAAQFILHWRSVALEVKVSRVSQGIGHSRGEIQIGASWIARGTTFVRPSSLLGGLRRGR